MANEEPVDVLVVEDSPSDRASIMEALQATFDDLNVVAVRDGAEALEFLFGHGAWRIRQNADPPKLVLLDLGLPIEDGFSVLTQVRSLGSDDALASTPVIVFTDSRASTDIQRAYRCGANSYIVKPVSTHEFQAIVENVGRYWIGYNYTAPGQKDNEDRS